MRKNVISWVNALLGVNTLHPQLVLDCYRASILFHCFKFFKNQQNISQLVPPSEKDTTSWYDAVGTCLFIQSFAHLSIF